MKKPILAIIFSIGLFFTSFSSVYAADAVLNQGQSFQDVIILDILTDLEVLKPDWKNDYYYAIYLNTGSYYFVDLIPKTNTYAYLLAKNYVDADLYTIDSWSVMFNKSTLNAFRYEYFLATKNLTLFNQYTYFDVDVTNKLFYSNLPSQVRYSYFDGSASTTLFPIDSLIFGYRSIPDSILNFNINNIESYTFFDFITSFDNWLSSSLNNLLFTDPYLSDYGSVYDFSQLGYLKYGVYLLFILTFVVVMWFVLGFVKSVYYFVKEIF